MPVRRRATADGLGLVLTKRLAEAHGAASREACWERACSPSRFRASRRAIRSQCAAGGCGAQAAPAILVVDDDAAALAGWRGIARIDYRPVGTERARSLAGRGGSETGGGRHGSLMPGIDGLVHFAPGDARGCACPHFRVDCRGSDANERLRLETSEPRSSPRGRGRNALMSSADSQSTVGGAGRRARTDTRGRGRRHVGRRCGRASRRTSVRHTTGARTSTISSTPRRAAR